jgi:AraC-like DNA-binding protein
LPRWKLLRVCEFVESNLGGSIKVADLAKVAALGGSHCNRAFRKSVAVTPRVFIRSRVAPTAKPRPKSECAFCHMASAKKDDVWTQF